MNYEKNMRREIKGRGQEYMRLTHFWKLGQFPKHI